MTTTTVLPPDAPSPRDEGLSPADLVRRHELRRMKAVATGVLVVAFVVWVVCVRALAAGAPSWVGFVRAAAEAAMVGGLADWFAVTALFRHPLGIPIPHTALIPSRKEALGQSLSDFVGTHFLAEDVVRERVRRVGVAARVGDWLALPANASRVSAEVATAARAAVTVLDDSDVQAVLEDTVLRRLTALPVGPPLGALLEGVVRDGSHRATVDLLVDHLRVWLADHREDVVEAVAAAAPGWSPRFVDEAVGIKVHTELLRIAAEVRADPQHPLRLTIYRALVQFADDLRHDPATQARVQAAKDRLLSREETRAAVADLAASARRVLTESLADPDSELRRRLTSAVGDLGRRLQRDAALRAKVDVWLENAAAYVVTEYRDELTRTITETVERWDGPETARRVELAAGRDLQFIRINGAVVGALAGLAIHAVGVFLG
mgnify:CR=1 FL=1